MNFIRKVNLKNWHDLEALKKDLAEGETPADPVCSFNTRECRMSVFALDKTERAARVAAAIVCRAQNLQDFEYVIFNSADVEEIGFQIKPSAGDTVDEEINNLHYDISCISAQELTKLTDRLISRERFPDTCNRVSKKDVARHIIEGIENGFIKESRVNKDVLQKAKKAVNPKR